MRIAATLACIGLALALSGCMSPSARNDFDPYDSGRGLAFSAILSVLVIAGIAVLIANLSSQRTPPPATPPPAAQQGWEPIEETPAAAPRPKAAPRTTSRSASKSAKPRRPAP